jgi:RHS repeat-associated protein
MKCDEKVQMPNAECQTSGIRRSPWLSVAIAILGGLTATLSSLAADKNGVSPNSISLPKGPGSVEGLGESFQPTLNTGTAKYGLNLKLPPGTAGHQPDLSLSYEGGAGNGPLGYGWDLSLPRIQRRSDKGIPNYGEDLGVTRADTFINEAREELIPRADGYFFSENEGAFVRYRFATNHWEGTDPHGTRLEFGLTADSRIEDPATGHIFAWLLERATDTRGNVIEYRYRSFPGEQNLHQKYLASVRYGPGASPWSSFHFVTFGYETRSDWFEDGRAGFLVRTGQRLKNITIGSQGPQLSSQLVGHRAGDFYEDGNADYLHRRYDLAYLDYAGTNSHWSLLGSVTLVGADGVTALPAARFDYAVSHPPEVISALNAVWTGIDEPPAVMDNALVDLVDLNADGLPDVLKTESGGGAHTVAVNQGPAPHEGGWAIRWAPPVDVQSSGTAWNFDLASDYTHLADMNGDGLADLVHKSAENAVFYFANRGQLSWGAREDMTLEGAAPPAPFGQPGVRTADIDFDKRIDIIQSVDLGGSIAFRVWFNLGNQSYAPPISVESAGGFDLAQPGVDLPDCNGDRIPDVIRIQPGAVQVAAGLGYGRFALARTMTLPDETLDEQQIARARLIDINGDGLADLVLERASPGECWYWLNLGNYSLTSRRTIVDLPGALSAQTVVRWADLNGNGTSDLIYADSLGTPRLQTVEVGQLISGGLSPNLLTRIENGIGRVTRIAYASSTRFALSDAANGRPWGDAVPFPITVVESMTTEDSLGHEYLTRFLYHDGFYDYAEKQFRGFAEVEQIKSGDQTAPTLVTRSHFDTGRLFDAMKGRLVRTVSETENGRVFVDETTTWMNPPRVLFVGTNGRPVRFAFPTGKVQQVRELDQGPPRRLESAFVHDDHGNLTRLADYGIVEDNHRSAFDDERVSVTDYAVNLNAWILRLPQRQRVEDENGVVVARSEFFYDDPTFAGANPGSVTVGNLTMRRDWVDPANANAYVATTRTTYDSYGNARLQLDPLGVAPGGAVDFDAGHVRALTYDADFHSFVVAETIHPGAGQNPLIFRAGFDPGFAAVTSATDFNTNVTRFRYDALGRLVRIVRPLDSDDHPTTEYEYVLRAPANYPTPGGLLQTGLVNYVETRRLDRKPGTAGAHRDHYLVSRQFSDGLGRILMTRTEAEPGPGKTTPRVVVSGAVLFNPRQAPARTLNPHFTTLEGSLEEQLAYENIETPGWTGHFHHQGALLSLDLAAAHQTRTIYDATLRAIQSVNADGSFQQSVFEPLVTRFFDENDTQPTSPHADTPVVRFVDGLGRLIQVDEWVRLSDEGLPVAELRPWTTRYTYDLNDCLVRLTDAQNNVKVLRYDGLRRKIALEDPDSGIWSYTHDAASNLREVQDAKGQRTRYTYDGINRLEAVDYLDDNVAAFSHRRSPDVRFHYDRPPSPVDAGDGGHFAARNTVGNLVRVEDTSGDEHISYDVRGRKEWIVKRIPDPFASGSSSSTPWAAYRTAFDYDSLDRVTRLVYPDQDQITYQYNARNLLERINGGPSGAIVPTMEYAPSGQPIRLTCGNGLETVRRYDERQRLQELVTHNPVRARELLHFRYDLDGVSNLRGILDERPGSSLPLDDPRRNSQGFTYDDRYRLTGVQYNPQASEESLRGTIQYRYDRIGNLLAQTSDLQQVEHGLPITDVGTLNYGARFNRQPRQPEDEPGPHAARGASSPGSVSAADYDANGNITSADDIECLWDFENRLVRVEDDRVRADYTYDYTGRRITKRVTTKSEGSSFASPASTATVYVGNHFEVRGGEQPTKYVFSGSIRVARITGTLSTNQRLQRIRLEPGWNLVSLAVTPTNLFTQLQSFPVLWGGGAYRWDDSLGNYIPVASGQAVMAGSVLWLKASTNAVIGVTGTYFDPTNRVIPPGGRFLAAAGLETWTPGLPPTIAAWNFVAASRQWNVRLPAELASAVAPTPTLRPGQVLYVVAPAEVGLPGPDPALRIVYYHQDHLGSSSVITDAAGDVVAETAFHPFGLPRHQHRPRPVDDPYQFSQKERDEESRLLYFEARYLNARLARFLSPDPKYSHPDMLSGPQLLAFLGNPQALNPYAYVFNNPLAYRDPSGLDAESNETKKHLETINKGSDFLGFVTGTTELFVKEGSGLWGVSKAGGAATALLGVAFKGVELIDNPNGDTASAFSWEVSKGAIGIINPVAGIAIYVGEQFGIDIGKGLNRAGRAIGSSLRDGPNMYEAYQMYKEDRAREQRFGQIGQIRRLIAANKEGIKNMEEVAPFLENTGYRAEAQNLRNQIESNKAEIQRLEDQITQIRQSRSDK